MVDVRLYLAVSILIALVAVALSKLLEHMLIKVDNHNPGTKSLPPAELAYLIGDGDLFHTVLVMAADLTQRGVKSTLAGKGPPEVLDYESKMWEISKDFIRKSAEQKIEPYLPSKASTDPIRYFRRLSSLYSAILKLIRSFTKEVAKDPRHIRKYFSANGLVRLVADFFTSGYQDSLNGALTEHLVEKQLIVSQSRCKQFSQLYLLLGSISTLLAILWTMATVPFSIAVVISAAGLITAAIIHLSLFLRDLIPLYPEVAQLLSHLHRKDWRISLARGVLIVLQVLSWTMIAGVFALVIGIGALILKLACGVFALEYLYIMTILALALIIFFASIKRGFVVEHETILTAQGKKYLHEARQRISKESPSVVFREMLQSQEYEALFSEIVAVYGITPLIIFA